MQKLIKSLLKSFQSISSFFWCIISGIGYDTTWQVDGKITVIRNRWLNYFKRRPCGKLIIGKNFTCHNRFSTNSIGIIQRCLFNVSVSGSKLIIGNNVGISGSTITVSKSIKIGDNVRIGSGCLITDTDSHQLYWENRLFNRGEIGEAPIVIEDNVFIGARSIILKGVTIGFGSVIGAGSVVTNDVPANYIAAGNPAKILKQINV